MKNTKALFFDRTITAWTKAIQVKRDDTEVILFTETSPFHPEDFLGGDQPCDIGTVRIMEKEYEVIQTSTAVFDNLTETQVFPDSKSDMYRGIREGKMRLRIAHHIKDLEHEAIEKGEPCLLSVNQGYRSAINKAHTAVHLMSIALNGLLKDNWTKDVQRLDANGNPDFDALAIDNSKIQPLTGLDTYRIGKSLRKRGFNSDNLFSMDSRQLSLELSKCVNELITDNSESPVIMSGDSLDLGSRRFWSCRLNHVDFVIPCGGTHVEKVKEIGKVKIHVDLNSENKTMVITTRCL